MAYVILFVIVCIVFFCFSKFRRKPAPDDDSLSLDLRHRYLAEFVPQHLESSGFFTPAFLERLAAALLETGNLPKLEQGDLLEGVNLREAYAALTWCTSVASARFKNRDVIESAEGVGARYVYLKFTRPEVCPRKPKENRYKVGEPVPLYPCEDCDCNPACLPWYKLSW